jgi:hypothetical protein
MKEVLSLISVALLGIGFVMLMILLWFANIAAWVIGWLWIVGWLN